MAQAPSKKGKKKRNTGRLVLSGLAIGAVCGLLVALATLMPFLRRLELISLDWRFQKRKPIVTLPEVGYVNMDNESCDMAGSWPWTRNMHVALVKTLKFYGARAAGYDVFYAEPSNVYVLPPAPGAAASPALTKDIFRYYDAEFEHALKEAGIIYLGEYLAQPKQYKLSDKKEDIEDFVSKTRKNWNTEQKANYEAVLPYTIGSLPFLANAVDWNVDITVPLASLSKASAGVGFEQIVPDALTGTVYDYPMFLYYDGHLHPSLALIIVKNALGIDLASVRGKTGEYIEMEATRPFRSSSGVEVPPATFRIPVNEKMRLRMNWSGPYFDTFFHISYKQLAFYYALNEAKRVMREHPPEPAKAGESAAALVELMRRDKMVPPEEMRPLAEEAAFAALCAPRLNQPDAELLAMGSSWVKTADPARVLQGLRLADEVRARANPQDRDHALAHLADADTLDFKSFAPDTTRFPKLDADHQREIARNVLGFLAKGELDKVQPLYFPPCLKSRAGGKDIALSPTMLQDKILMIGLEGEGTIDLNPQPYQKACAMVALHANAINTLITHQFLHYPRPAETLAWIFGFALLMGVVSYLFSEAVGAVFLVLCLAAFAGYVLQRFSAAGHHVEWVAPSLALVFTHLVSMGVQLYLAFREKQKVKGMFGKMVSPDVLKVMSENPDLFSLSGVRQSCTSYFSSLEGFADMAKGVTAQELPGLLSHYLTPASQIITSYEGYIDKYESHIIMADFGVPIPDTRHTAKCLFASIEQQLDLRAFKLYVRARFGKKVVTSMGVNTGFVSAGNMGSDKKMQYTIMGDTVNTAARFRPANWIYNQLGSIVIGKGTYPLAKDFVEARILDKLLLKGKLKPITIYQVMGWHSEAYRELRKGVDVLPLLRTCWTRLPPEKIHGYEVLWSDYAKHTQSGLAREIRDFFAGQVERSAQLLLLELKGQIVETWRNYLIEEEHFKGLAGRGYTPLKAGSDWKEKLHTWTEHIEADLEELQHKAGDKPEAHKLHLSLDDIYEKVHALKERLALEAELPPPLKKTWEDVRAYISTDYGGDATEYARQYEELFRGYETEAVAFAEKVAARREEYHETMAIAGSLTEEQRSGRAAYEGGLGCYWKRDWDGAEAKFKEALKHMPGDNAATCLMDRVGEYRKTPPKDNWQGEFVQTKK